MSDQIDRNTMQVHPSVNTPDYSQDAFLNISGKILPDCDKKYWKIVDEEVVEMTTVEKAVVDYVEPPITPTLEEAKTTKIKSINTQCQTYILSKYPLTIQSSAWGGVYGTEFANTLRIFLSSCVELENASANAVAAMTDMETVNAFEVDFTLVV